MRGSPSIHLLLFIAGFAIIAMKLADFTGRDAGGGDQASPGTRGSDPTVVVGADHHPEGEHSHVEVPSHIRIHFSHPPALVSLEQDGTELVPDSIHWTESPVDFEVEVKVSHEGDEMFLAAEWAEGTPDTALTVEIEPDGFESRFQTVWTDEAELDELILFEW